MSKPNIHFLNESGIIYGSRYKSKWLTSFTIFVSNQFLYNETPLAKLIMLEKQGKL